MPSGMGYGAQAGLQDVLARLFLEAQEKRQAAENARRLEQADRSLAQGDARIAEDVRQFDVTRSDATARAQQDRADAEAALKSHEDFEATLPVHLRGAFHASGHKQAFQPGDFVNAPETRDESDARALKNKRAESDIIQGRELRLIGARRTDDRANEPKLWVSRGGQLIRISESEYKPGDQPANTREQGRPVISGDANRLADFDTSLDDLDVLERDLGTTGTASKIGAMMPNVVTDVTGLGANAKSRQAVIDRVKQVIGKALEGGVLRKEDEVKYEKILPTIGDEPSVAKSKLTGLREAIKLRRQRLIESLGDSGFDVSRFNARPSGAANDAAAKAQELIKKYGGGQ